MKKIGLLALAAAALVGTATASAQEVTYVPDCTQGLLINKAANNWFITAQGGANILFGHYDVHQKFGNRIGPQANLFVGKWATPVFGFRFGASWIMPKGATVEDGFYRKMNSGLIDGKYYTEKFQAIGPEFDLLLNLTNWWCGYKPDRVYNAVLHGGAGAYWTFARRYKGTDLKWRAAHNTILFANVGLQNNFRVSKHVQLFLDAQFELIDFSNIEGMGKKAYQANYTASLNAGITYNFGKTEWNCPETAVCPTWKYTDAEGDDLVRRLNQANNRIADLENQLANCDEGRGKKRQVNECEGLATIYYPINVYTLDRRDKMILNSVAEVMNNNPGTQYTLTGWADNYTGNDEINTRLRRQRVDGVKKYLLGRGVSEGQMDATIDNNNLTDYGIQGAPLDRAVTISEK